MQTSVTNSTGLSTHTAQEREQGTPERGGSPRAEATPPVLARDLVTLSSAARAEQPGSEKRLPSRAVTPAERRALLENASPPHRFSVYG